MLKKSILCLIALLAMFFSACFTPKYVFGVPLEKEKVDLIVKNETTEAEVLEMFGEPVNKVMMGDQVQWMYVYQDANVEMGLASSTTKGRYQKLDIQIKDGVVTNFVYSDSPMPTQRGSAW
jgi:outer membrane protein assembly factor BamE (lipoprotein component of BamABCDE complex)